MRWLLRLTLGLVALLAIARCHGLDSRDYLCELAVAHLTDCCPGFPTGSIQCVSEYGCGYTQLPVLRSDESECILALDCGDIDKRSLCGEVPALPDAVRRSCPDAGGLFVQCDYDDVSATRKPVCQ